MPTPKNTRLLLLKKTEPEPPVELIQQALDRLMDCDLYQFATELDSARTMWRAHRELVEAPEFPEHLHDALLKGGAEPGDISISDEFMQLGYRESLLPGAVKIARGWANKDDKLSRMAAATQYAC